MKYLHSQNCQCHMSQIFVTVRSTDCSLKPQNYKRNKRHLDPLSPVLSMTMSSSLTSTSFGLSLGRSVIRTPCSHEKNLKGTPPKEVYNKKNLLRCGHFLILLPFRGNTTYFITVFRSGHMLKSHRCWLEGYWTHTSSKKRDSNVSHSTAEPTTEPLGHVKYQGPFSL